MPSNEPPLMLDGARVVEYAILDRSAPGGRVSVVSGGTPVDSHQIAGLVVAENLAEGGYFLLHCNERWECLAAASFPDVTSAHAAAEHSYSGLTARWAPFHELSAEEAAEVETTRKFLRELARDFPNN